MKDAIREILDALPDPKARSCLEPYRDLIIEMRHRKFSYREISRLLKDRCGLQISHSAIHNFVRLNPLQRLESAVPQDSVERSDRRTENVRAELEGNGGLMPQPDEVRERIATMKRLPALLRNEKTTFQFDPDQPLRLDDSEF